MSLVKLVSFSYSYVLDIYVLAFILYIVSSICALSAWYQRQRINSIWQYVALVAQLLESDKRYVTLRNVQYFIYACPHILHFNKYNYNIITY